MKDEVVIFKTDDKAINVEDHFKDETAWLTKCEDRWLAHFLTSKKLHIH